MTLELPKMPEELTLKRFGVILNEKTAYTDENQQII